VGKRQLNSEISPIKIVIFVKKSLNIEFQSQATILKKNQRFNRFTRSKEVLR
jgi:hypothetical protein